MQEEISTCYVVAFKLNPDLGIKESDLNKTMYQVFATIKGRDNFIRRMGNVTWRAHSAELVKEAISKKEELPLITTADTGIKQWLVMASGLNFKFDENVPDDLPF